MLTRLKVQGFKNLVNVDVRFGPFTCVAGPNGAGKSNLFDAIAFLSRLADHPFVEAAAAIRDEAGRTSDPASLFLRAAGPTEPEMLLEAEMLIPADGTDDFGQPAEATTTLLTYRLRLRKREPSTTDAGPVELVEETLNRIPIGDAAQTLAFPHKPVWRSQVAKGRRTTPFISTTDGGDRMVMIHQDGRQGRANRLLAANLPRTALSSLTTSENPTALLVRRELQSWRLLQLEPSALRQPDSTQAIGRLGLDGSHLPATLYRLMRRRSAQGGAEVVRENTLAEVANRLMELIDDVREVDIELDEKRDLLTLAVRDSLSVWHPARSLSDGTLRFLALAVIELDSESPGLLCLEEPENGIHPERLPALLQLLQAIPVDPEEPPDSDNPLRQVIVNSHSPGFVQLVGEGELLVADASRCRVNGAMSSQVVFRPLQDTWRHKADPNIAAVAPGRLLAYLQPPTGLRATGALPGAAGRRERTVRESPSLQMLLPGTDDA